MAAASLARPAHLARLGESAPLGWVAARPDYRWWVVGTVCVGAFLGQLDASIAGLVLPTLEEAFRAPVAAVEWVAIAYLLTLAALVVPFGRLADLAGRKRLYTVGFLVFIAGSALCGLAPTLGWLVAFRVVQAVGAALLQANSVAIVAAAAGPRALGRAVGVQGAAQAVGLAVGPSVGGLLIALVGWRWVFFIAVPFGLLGAALGWLILPRTARPAAGDGARDGAPTPGPARERFDWAGAALFGPAVAAGLLVLTEGNAWGWTSPRLVGLVAAAVTLLGAFLLAERRAPAPLVDFELFRDRVFGTGIVAGLLSYTVLFGSLFLLPFYFQRVLGLAPAEAGLALSPVPLALGLVAPVAGALSDRLGSRLPTVAGMVLTTVALLALAALAAAPGGALAVALPALAALAVLGLGLGLFTPPNNSAVMGSAPPHRLGVAGGILNMTRSLGTSAGVAATGAVLALRLAARTGQPAGGTVGLAPTVLLPAFRESLLFLAALAALAGIVAAGRQRAGAATGAGAPHPHRTLERRALEAAEAAGG
jgi:EmrB/QacA subfamily drug resistance transporter